MRSFGFVAGCALALLSTPPAVAASAVSAGTDSIPPTILSARVIYDPADPSDTGFVEFIYSEPVDWFGAVHYANYIDVNGGVTAEAGYWLPPDRARARFTEDFNIGSCEQVRVINVADLAGNVIVDDGIGNVFTFHLQERVLRGRMSEHMKDDDSPPHAFAVEGSVAPLSWAPLCDVDLVDADGDSIWTRTVFFDIPCSTATSGTETRDVEFHFTHQCAEAETTNRLVTLDLAATPDGRDTLDIWWNDEVPEAPIANDVDVIFRVSALSHLPPFGAGDTLGVLGSEFPLTWDDPPLTLLRDDGVAPDDVAGDGIATARRTFLAGTHPRLLYRLAWKAAADTAFTFECPEKAHREAFLDDATYSTSVPLEIDVNYDDCLGATTAPSPSASGIVPRLSPPFPNPAMSRTRVSWTMPVDAHASVRVLDVGGRVVRSLVDGILGAGTHAVVWDGRTAADVPAASGVYFVRLDAGGHSETRRVVLRR